MAVHQLNYLQKLTFRLKKSQPENHCSNSLLQFILLYIDFLIQITVWFLFSHWIQIHTHHLPITSPLMPCPKLQSHHCECPGDSTMPSSGLSLLYSQRIHFQILTFKLQLGLPLRGNQVCLFVFSLSLFHVKNRCVQMLFPKNISPCLSQ